MHSRIIRILIRIQLKLDELLNLKSPFASVINYSVSVNQFLLRMQIPLTTTRARFRPGGQQPA